MLLRSKALFRPYRYSYASYRCIKVMSGAEIVKKIQESSRVDSVALIDASSGQTLTYRDLDLCSSIMAQSILSSGSLTAGDGKTIGSFNKPGITFTLAMLAAWKIKRTFVPLCITHSPNEVNYVVEDSNIGCIVCNTRSDVSKEVLESLAPVLIEDHIIDYSSSLASAIDLSSYAENEDAVIVYTSGTTGRPKGVVHTHNSLYHIIQALVISWEYTAEDKILHFLPLYHIHGLFNKLMCMIWVGATVEFLPTPSATIIWDRLVKEHDQPHEKALTLFMAVPTVYARLLELARTLDAEKKAKGVTVMQKMRLMVSGSAALPDVVMGEWQILTGQVLLERYGMTEIGMALSNSYREPRLKGQVGKPLPYVQCRLVDTESGTIIEQPSVAGELQVAGDCVFKGYLNKPQATAESFDAAWFKTGDIAEVDGHGVYRILGRASADIIKSSGYKLSALEIERELLSHPRVSEAAVLGVPHAVFGETIIAVVMLRQLVAGSGTKEEDFHAVQQDIESFLVPRLAKYKWPRKYYFVSEIPRNHLGKVGKKTLVKDLNLDITAV